LQCHKSVANVARPVRGLTHVTISWIWRIKVYCAFSTPTATTHPLYSGTTNASLAQPVGGRCPDCYQHHGLQQWPRHIGWLCSWAQLQRYWRRWSSAAPPSELAALLGHVARSLPLAAPAGPT